MKEALLETLSKHLTPCYMSPPSSTYSHRSGISSQPETIFLREEEFKIQDVIQRSGNLQFVSLFFGNLMLHTHQHTLRYRAHMLGF